MSDIVSIMYSSFENETKYFLSYFEALNCPVIIILKSPNKNKDLN